MRKIYRIWVQAAALMAVMTLAACEGELNETLRTPSAVNVDTGAVTQNSLHFTWSQVSGASGYNYRLVDESEAIVSSGGVNEAEVTISGLEAATTYRFAVQARGGGSKLPSEYSAYVSATTSGSTDPGPDPDPDPRLALPVWEEDGLVRAFPGAEGGGMFVTGGRGGTVYHVTKLTDDGSAGTLRHGVNQSGPRTIVFDVGGVIELRSRLNINNGDLTIAGQTAPGDGICIKDYSVRVSADNVIIRYMRFRMGDETNFEDDALWGRNQKGIVIDHCSVSWSTDECSSFYANENFTMQWCIVSESLRNSVHGKGSHGYGAIWGGVNASFHHNLLAHHDSRNPRFDGADVYRPADAGARLHTDDRAVDFRNCVVYNFSNYPAYGGEAQKINVAGNYYKWGPGSLDGPDASTSGKRRLYLYYVDNTKEGVTYDYPSVYTGGNTNRLETLGGYAHNVNSDNWNGFVRPDRSLIPESYRLAAMVPITPDGTAAMVSYHSAEDAFDKIMDHAGASLRRDAVDTRVTNDTRTGTATYMTGGNGSINGYVDTQSAVGGWPAYAGGTPETDTDGDGIPDSWEDEFGLDKNSAADGNLKTLDPSGRYTNLEIYLWWLVKDITEKQVEGSSYIQLR